MIASIDMMCFTSHANRQIGQEIKRRSTNIINSDIAAQRRIIFVPLQDIAEITDAAGGKRLYRSC